MTLFHVIILVVGFGVGAGLGALFGYADVQYCGVIGLVVGFVFSITPWFGATIDWIVERATRRHWRKK